LILFIVTAVICRPSLSFLYTFFKLENQIQEIQGLAVGFTTVGAFMILARAWVLRFGKLDEFNKKAQQAVHGNTH
jgi:hypothetical protein